MSQPRAFKSPYPKGVSSRAAPPRRKEPPNPGFRYKPVRTRHQFDEVFAKGRGEARRRHNNGTARCNRCGQPRFAVENDPCRGRLTKARR